MPPEADCLFCGVAHGRIPAEVVREDDQTVAFRDISPQAPVHVLVIPRKHLTSLDEASPSDTELLGALMAAARDVARSEGIAEAGYRTVINTGDGGGQTVHHLHVHVLGGRPMKWPPG
jgi:histidine triad (HIT) family protein